MNILKKMVVTFATAATLFVTLMIPHAVYGQTTPAQIDTCAELKKKFENSGGKDVIAGVPEYCSVESLYTKFVNMALFAAGIVAVIAVIYGGYMYMTARGNDAQTKKAKSILIWAIIGLVIVLAAATIVNAVTSGLVENRFV